MHLVVRLTCPDRVHRNLLSYKVLSCYPAVVAVLSMVVSALIEVWRLQIVAANNLQNVDYDVTPVPMSVWWQVGPACNAPCHA